MIPHLLALKWQKNITRQVTSTVVRYVHNHDSTTDIGDPRNDVTLGFLTQKLHYNSSQGHVVRQCVKADCRHQLPTLSENYSVHCMTSTLCKASSHQCRAVFVCVHYQVQYNNNHDGSSAACHHPVMVNWWTRSRTVLCIHTLAAINIGHHITKKRHNTSCTSVNE